MNVREGVEEGRGVVQGSGRKGGVVEGTGFDNSVLYGGVAEKCWMMEGLFYAEWQRRRG